LRLADGHAVTTSQQWLTQRRPQILRLFEQNIFGVTPAAATHAITHARIIEHNEHALNGLAVREQVTSPSNPHPASHPPHKSCAPCACSSTSPPRRPPRIIPCPSSSASTSSV